MEAYFFYFKFITFKGKGKTLTSEEKSQKQICKQLGQSNWQISKLWKRSLCLVILGDKLGDNYGQKIKHNGANPKLCYRTKKRIKRIAANNCIFSRKIKQICNVSVHPTTIQSFLKKSSLEWNCWRKNLYWIKSRK